LRFFAASDQGGTADSTGHQGFYFHFLDAEILTGIGRMPAVLGLNLEAAGVACDDVAGVHVDDFLRTSNSRIFAAGDVCLAHQYTNTAQASARIVVRSALLFGRRRMSALTTPW
jgi:pyruvate/2-oxoglutarate dehydrogenase complex dihydrolipoamide dehydrogenase (E3) component